MNNPKYRWKLNKDQLTVLELLYKFRFGSSDLIAQYFGKPSGVFVYKRLQILVEQGFIGKRYDSSYRIKGKPAAYYLLPEGARRLQAHRDPSDTPITITALYKLPLRSEAFVQECFSLFAVYLNSKARYGDKLLFFTKYEIGTNDFDYFPSPLPNAYIRIEGNKERQYFLDIYDQAKPMFTHVKTIKNYLEYANSGNWAITETELPTFLTVCTTPSLQKRLRKHFIRERNAAWDTTTIFTTTNLDELLTGKDAIWQGLEDLDEPSTLEALS